MSLDDREHYLYRAFDEYDRLLYVGRTCDPPGRFSSHRSTSAWWPLMVRHQLDGPMTFGEVQQRERDAIISEAPLYNMDTPHRGVVLGALERLRDMVAMVAIRDGWHPIDVSAIAAATASAVSDQYRVGTPIHRAESQAVLADINNLMCDPIAAAWIGYVRLLRTGWAPELTQPEKIRGVLPDRWNDASMGTLPAWMYRLAR